MQWHSRVHTALHKYDERPEAPQITCLPQSPPDGSAGRVCSVDFVPDGGDRVPCRVGAEESFGAHEVDAQPIHELVPFQPHLDTRRCVRFPA
eukprot:3931661-Rhodomonas_salina.2